jgi:hypothetical protein
MTKNVAMKNRLTTRLFGRNFLLLSLISSVAASSALRADTNFSAGSFVEGLPGFISVASGVDPTDGTTYLVGRNDLNQAILKKYDSSGTQIVWDGTNVADLVVGNISPTSVAIGVGTTNFYIAGGSKIIRLSTKTGRVIATADTANSNFKIQALYYRDNALYAAGNLSGSTATLFGKNAPSRGAQAGVLVKFSGSLPTTAQAVITYGNTDSAANNTADSIVVDDNGDVYVSGHLDGGSFASSVFTPGKWRIDRKYANVGVGNIATAEDVYFNGNHVASVETAFADVIHLPDVGREDYVTHASAIIFAPVSGNYQFSDVTDDGSWLKVDGQYVIYDDTTHANSVIRTGSISLSAGLHSIEFLQFNHSGPGSAEVKWTVPGASEVDVPAATFSNHQNKGYVFKFSNDLGSMRNAYFTTSETSGSGGRLFGLNYTRGWIYAIGFWKGDANNPAIGHTDPSKGFSQDVDIVKLDTGLQLKARATVKGAADNTGYSITADDNGNAYITGSYGPESVDFFGNNDATNSPFTSISSPSTSLFVAQLDSNFAFKWVTTPSGTPPTFDFVDAPRLSWNPILQRLFWSGYFTSGTLTMGQPDTLKALSSPKGFLAVLDPDGKFTERVNLTVLSDFGLSGSQVKPFGGPALNATVVMTETNTRPVIKGAQVTVSVPNYLYRDMSNTDITIATQQDASKIDSLAQTRIGCTGYSVDENVVNGTATSYTFTLSKDTIVKFNWIVEHALTIDRDFSATAGTDSPTTPGHIQGLSLYSDATGNPVPAVKKSWVPENETVIASIDSEVADLDYQSRGLPVKYVVTGYEAYGPPNTLGGVGTTNFITFTGSDLRRQVPQFVMSGPAGIKYHWKLKIGIQVNTTGVKSTDYPLIQVVKDPGQLPPTQPNGVGSGTFWFDENTKLNVGTIKNIGTTQLKGWMNGDGIVIPSTGDLTNLTTTFSTNGQTYVAWPISELKRPGRVMWDYGDRIFEETVFIGNSVTFSTVDDPAIRSILRTDLKPDHVDVVDAPSGSTGDDMGIWDPQGKKYYPLRPGVVYSYWFTSQDPADRVIIKLTFKYPVSPHYEHIANTPAVNLDPSSSDFVTFKELKYTEPTTGAALDTDGKFTATGPGKTVLLFSETSSSGRGGSIETMRVRVVETKNWNDQLPATQQAIIGQKITSPYDTAGLGSGYVFFPNARYNPFVYNRTNISGPIIPVNQFPSAGPDEQLVVVWYEIRDQILWPYKAVRYDPVWPTPATGLNRIVIASRYGNESVAQDGTDQIVTPATTIGTNVYPAETTFNPARFQQVQIYNQPDRSQPGFNPNEEHALLAPSLRSASVSPRPMAAYALRDNDLNVTNRDGSYTSDPYVLVQFFDSLDSQYKMKVYNVVRSATNLNAGDLSYEYNFEQNMEAGEPVIPFYPLPQVIGATPAPGTYARDGQPTIQQCFWKDHKGTPWAISGDSFFYASFFYPLTPDFWWPASDAKQPGDFVAFLPNQPAFSPAFFDIDYTRNDQHPEAQEILYTTTWPQNVPILKVGETLTFPGGEYHQDNPTTTVVNDDGDITTEDTPGLPGVVAFAAGQIVFDSLNPVMDDQRVFTNYTARLFPALEERTVDLPLSDFPSLLLPANKRTTVKNGLYVFNQLPSSLQKRVFYDPIRGKLGIRGFLNDKDISDPTLTASPPAVYVLEPNVMTTAEKQVFDGSASDSPFVDLAGTSFSEAVDALYDLCRNPNQLDQNNNGVDQAYRVGLEQKIKVNPSTGLPLTQTNFGIVSVQRDQTKGAPLQALGPGLALVANPAFLDPSDTNMESYVTVAENNSDSLGSSPVALHIIKVKKNQRYRGAIKTVLSDNVFDENIILRHTADFGGNADDLVFEWWYRPEDGTTALPPDRATPPSPWKLFPDPSGNQGRGFYQLTLKGNPSAPEVLLADTLFFVRYRHKNEVTDGVNWEVTQPNGESRCVLNDCHDGIPYDWAGAGNSTPKDLDQDGLPDYKPQLAQGWIKRVLDAVNPYEARIRDFSSDSPATYSSMIRELGAAFEGDVALNPDKNVIENVGLIALYQTILDRGLSLSVDLSTPISTPAIANALQLASTRLSDFYMLLGNEAYSDALNPMIGYGSDSVEYGNLAPSVFAFENQVSSLLEEELALLRGQDDTAGTPVYNRLFWNFTKGEGEAAYAMKYNISDVNNDGFIDENDAMILYPQGHGDAWGHYLTAIEMQYDLLRNPNFNWVSRSEFYNLQDIVIPVDFLDERKFAQVAAAKAKVGAELVNLTYREKYVANPEGQWQGYTDTDKNRAWGVEGWARRAGQGAFFDWVTANAILPAQHPNTNYTGIQKVDRTTVQDIAVVSANLLAVQTTMDQVNNGNNPLGVANGALAFDIDPTLINADNGKTQTHFEQIYNRALAALKNAKTTFDNASQLNNLIRQVANSTEDFENKVTEQDIAYRNQLIEIFGTPYDGTIGSGKAYPPGYQGPDTMLYMYVPVNNVNDTTVPKPPASFYNAYSNQISGSAAVVTGVDNSWKTTYQLTFLDQNKITNSINYTDFTDTNSNPLVTTLDNLTLPIAAAGYTFIAPPDWGTRTSPGELQRLITQMVQAQADLDSAIAAWDSVQGEMISSLEMINAKFDYNKKIRDNMKGQIAYDSVIGALGLTFKSISAINELSSEIADGAGLTAALAIPNNTPTAGLAVSLGDALAPARAAIKGLGFSAKTTFIGFKLLFDKLADGTELAQSIGDAVFALQIDGDERDLDMIQSLSQLQNDASNEGAARIVIFKQLQVLSELSDQYRAKLAEGFRLMEERAAFNQRVAAQTQQNRYQDMTFRVSRNAALEKYRSAFDLAARYAYLAGTAYDYDLNLGWSDAGSPVNLLNNIVHDRTIGLVGNDGMPAVGAGGLAEDLAVLKANYDALKTRMGLNNPQIENATFSLRREGLRIQNSSSSDTNWSQTLRSAAIYKDDLWQVPEFREYCRPFASETNGPQPGLVIPFSTQIRPNKNFFGWPLGGADSSYDPSVYTTKISSVGVWFAGYDTTNLPSTPRVYLIPVGQDIMTVPTSPDLEVRLWDVIDQSIPVPYPSVTADLGDPTWKPLTDSLNGAFGNIRRYSSFRAFPFDHSNLSDYERSTITFDSRLIGRSAWNTRWLLIIPGATLNADPNQGLNLFINSVKDINLIINSYGYSGN